MRVPRTVWLFAAACVAAFPAAVAAQAWPSRTVRIIVPHPPGGPADVPPRAIAQTLSQVFGKPFIIENREGADGVIGMEACAKSTPDGHTICTTHNGVITIAPFVRAKLPYEPLRDFVPIIDTGALYSMVLAHPSVPSNNLREAVELARAKPDTLNFGTVGPITPGGLFLAWLRAKRGVMFYPVPFKSPTQSLQAAVAGHIQFATYAFGAGAKLAETGKLKALAVINNRRLSTLPNMPCAAEFGFDSGVGGSWFGYFAPAGTPRDVVQKLNTEMAKLIRDPEFKAKYLVAQGFDVDAATGASADEFAKFLKEDRAQFAELAEAIGLKPE
jgi:tripartite-type tricarboxylate transporter receptor subunit TctC